MQKIESKKEIYYLSRLLHSVECEYTSMDKLCLSLFHACTKLEYYLLPNEILVLHKFDIVKLASSTRMIDEIDA